MKYLKLFENFGLNKELVENLLRDLSDDDIPVNVQFYNSNSPSSGAERILILIGNEESEIKKPLRLDNYTQNFISLNNYLKNEEYSFVNVACWINPFDEMDFYFRPTVVYSFEDFIELIENVEFQNQNLSGDKRKVILVIDMCYQNNNYYGPTDGSS